MRSPTVSLPSRRHLLQSAAALGGISALGGCALLEPFTGTPRISIVPVRARMERVFDITVCSRPFRAQGPRLDVEHIGKTTVVHNYGHGGSGWSLSWGSADVAVSRAMESSPRKIAVIGCGVIGLTSAITAQRAGAEVTIYALELISESRSARATGSWSPDSRIALADQAAPGFPELWEQMARKSYKTLRRYIGLAGDPVEWTDRYFLFDGRAPVPARVPATAPSEPLEFASYSGRIRDISPRSEELPKEATPFPVTHVRRAELLTFNIASYGHTLLIEFLEAGGRFKRAEFHAPSDLRRLPEKVVINCTGYGARELWNDKSVVPVRGQITWLIPQSDVHYGIYYRNVGLLARRDGIVVQSMAGDMEGYGDPSETPDRGEAERTVGVYTDLFARMRLTS